MNKRSHLFVTEKIVKNLPEEKRSWVLHYVEDFYTLAHNFVLRAGFQVIFCMKDSWKII